uniref:interleukin-12 receptor subunit beta-2 n=1 Tax=Scatophagus argus TaxID=75038 RepID=UPI001ED8371B|nr:interleukin-12 receptor subunit beta-2 [Scatophagus argus]XP_046246523.1 interleukin-12 receptor subunit beta-2 [Scatophagus argus]
MASMSQTWSLFTAVTVLALQLCAGQKSCAIWSTAGPVVQRGSSFKVYCTFKCKCKGSMYSDHPPTLLSDTEFNFTTTYFNVVNITKNRTYSCQCTCPPALDPCGLDISAGYPPDRPKNISCIYTVKNYESGVVFCTWNQGRDTYLRNSSVLWVRTVSGNRTAEPVAYKAFNKGSDLPSATLIVPSSVQLISVWVQAQNQLGSAVSVTTNYTLSDIAMPKTPELDQPNCSSSECTIQVKQSVRTQHLEIQYSRVGAQTWTSYPESSVQMSSSQVQSISYLEPYGLYQFRARSKFSSGLWSEWSTHVSGWTQEEAPAKEPDVWYAEPSPDFKYLKVYWKEMNISIARGKITNYKLRVHSQNSGLVFSTNVSADARNYSVLFCASCEVTVWACNSKGLSPPARITTHHTKAKSLKVVKEAADSHSVTISWRKPETAPRHTAYVVEWYPEGHKLEELRWVRMGRNENHAVLIGIQPFECYEGAVYAVYNDSSVSCTRFTGITTLESAPAVGPSIQEKDEGNKVEVTWREIPRGQRGGCITSYTIYLEKNSGDLQAYSIAPSERTHTIKDLSPGAYNLWMTASTAEGESKPGQNVKFFIQQETQLSLLLVCAVVSCMVLFLLCLCQNSAVKQRFLVFLQCVMLDDVPDPANSKWAKECTQEKGKIKLQLESCNSSVTKEEEEPILVNVEELPKQSNDVRAPTDVSSQQLRPQTCLGPLSEPGTLPYPLSTYIKSFSHDSDSSNHTQTSLDTTIDYISAHGLGNMDEEDQEEDREDEFAEIMGFLPSHHIITEPLEFGGKLTLDTVKIDCSDLFQNNV